VTPRVRRLALAVAILLVALFAVARVRRSAARKRAGPLAQAWIDFLETDFKAYGGLEAIVAANRHDCAKAESLGLANFEALAPLHKDAFERMQRLQRAASVLENEAAAEIAVARLGDRPQQLEKQQKEAIDTLRMFKKECPAQAAALDRRLLEYANPQ
jgi:hypothetical protein